MLLESRKARVARVGWIRRSRHPPPEVARVRWWIKRSRRPPPEVVYDALLIHPTRA